MADRETAGTYDTATHNTIRNIAKIHATLDTHDAVRYFRVTHNAARINHPRKADKIHTVLEEYGVGLGCVHDIMAHNASLFVRNAVHEAIGCAVDDIRINGLADNDTICTLWIDIVIQGIHHLSIAYRGIQCIAKQP